MECLGPRMHISSTGKIEEFTLIKDYPQDPATGILYADRSDRKQPDRGYP